MATPPTIPKDRGAVSAIVSVTLSASLMVALSLSQFGPAPDTHPDEEYIPVINPPPSAPPPLAPPPEPQKDKKIQPPPEPPPPLPSLDQLEIHMGNGVGIPIQSVTDFYKLGPVEDIVDTRELDSDPEPIRQIRPVTPQSHRHHAAEVQVILVVDTSGNVQDAAIHKSTNAAFNRAALDAARRWVFTPGYVGGKAVKFKIIVPMVSNPS